VFGLAVDPVDFLGRTPHVRLQVRMVGKELVFAPPKGGREREVPLPDVVSMALAENLQSFPAMEVTLPWREPGGDERTAALMFTNGDGGALTRASHLYHGGKPGSKRPVSRPAAKTAPRAQTSLRQRPP
jgi:hypothetical protein